MLACLVINRCWRWSILIKKKTSRTGNWTLQMTSQSWGVGNQNDLKLQDNGGVKEKLQYPWCRFVWKVCMLWVGIDSSESSQPIPVGWDQKESRKVHLKNTSLTFLHSLYYCMLVPQDVTPFGLCKTKNIDWEVGYVWICFLTSMLSKKRTNALKKLSHLSLRRCRKLLRSNVWFPTWYLMDVSQTI